MEDNAVQKRAPRKVATKTVRKAPVHTSGSEAVSRRSLGPLIAVAVFVVLIGGSLAIGFSDDGQINIADTINHKKNFGTDAEREELKDIPVQQTRTTLPDGGLVPTTDADPNTPTLVTDSASSTASSTEETASSTEEAATSEASEESEASAQDTTPTDTPQ